jgi:hypothetical protein
MRKHEINMVENTMTQMPWKTAMSFLYTIISFLKLYRLLLMAKMISLIGLSVDPFLMLCL